MTRICDILIFSKAPKDYGPMRLLEEANKLGLDTEIISYPLCNFIIKKDEVTVLWKDKPMPKAEMVVFRAPGGDGFYIPQRDYLLHWFDEQGAQILNKETYIKWSRLDKIAQHFEFQKAGIPFVESKNYGANQAMLETTTEFPVIVKHNLISSHGRDVIKINSKEEFEKILESAEKEAREGEKLYRARTLLVQPFLKAGKDLRVIVIGGEPIGAMLRTAQEGQYLTNYSVGGKVENYDLSKDPEAVEIVKKVIECFTLSCGGIDLMKDEEGNWLVLEVNRACQFKGFEELTGINVAKSIIEYLQSVSEMAKQVNE